MGRHLPNLLSALRLASAPLAAWLLLHDHDTAALSLFGFAALSDAADGAIARQWGFTSRFGAWLDPAADKLLMLSCLISLLHLSMVPFSLVALVLARDIAVAAGALSGWALSLPLRIAPLTIGKAAALVQVGYIGSCLLMLASDWDAPHLLRAGAYTVAVFTVLSGAAYAGVLLRALFFGGHTA